MKCTVVIPVHNSAHTLGATLASVLAQEGVDFEVIVVDDGSVDRPEQVTAAMSDPRVSLIRRPHEGVSSARNHGAARSTGTAIVFLDADDEVKTGWLTALSGPLADPDIALVSCSVIFRRAGVDHQQVPRRLGPAFNDTEALFLAGAFCVRRDLWERCHGYASDLHFGENTELGIRLTAELRSSGFRAVSSHHALLVSHRAPLWIYDPAAVADSAARVLREHAEAMGADRHFRFDYLTTLGVNAARCGRWDDSLQNLREAWRLAPTRPIATARALLTFMPMAARWVWTVAPPRALLPPISSLCPPSVDVSVIVPTFQGAGVVAELLSSLAREEPARPWEVVVADNGSTDETTEIVARFAALLPIRLVDASGARGVATARNIGAAGARGRSLLFVDQDDVPRPGFVDAMADALEGADLVGPKIDCATLNPGWVRHSRTLPQEHGLGQHRLPWVYGSGLGIRRHVFFAARGFDAQFTEGGEDVDLCWRIVNRGYHIAYAGDAVLSYRFRSTIPDLYRQARAYGRAGARLQALYRTAGLDPPSPVHLVRHWLGVLRRLATATTKAKQARAAVLLGNRVGRLEGALRHHVLYG